MENLFDLDAKISEIDPCIGKKYSIFSTEYFWAMLSQVSVEHDNNYWVNCVKSQDCRRTLAGEARTKAGNDTYLLFFLQVYSMEAMVIHYLLIWWTIAVAWCYDLRSYDRHDKFGGGGRGWSQPKWGLTNWWLKLRLTLK